MRPVDRLILSAIPGETLIALMIGDEIVELHVDREQPRRGDVFLGRISSINSAARMAFVDIGQIEPAFLSLHEQMAEGKMVLVQVVTPSRRDKNIAVTMSPATAEKNTGSPRCLWHRTALEEIRDDNPEISFIEADDLFSLNLAKPVFPDACLSQGCFEESGAAAAFDEALLSEVPLAGGGRIIIEETAALTAIDIDAGGGKPIEANYAAMTEIAKQIRLRGLAGHLLIDVIPSKKKAVMQRIIASLSDHLVTIPNPPRFVGTTRLGLFELVRTRNGPSLSEQFLTRSSAELNPLSALFAGLRHLLRESFASPSSYLTLVVPPVVAACFHARPLLQKQISGRLGRPFSIQEKSDIFHCEVIDKVE